MRYQVLLNSVHGLFGVLHFVSSRRVDQPLMYFLEYPISKE